MSQHNIIDFKTGWQTSKEDFVVENDAFPVLENAIVDHGRVVKIAGYNKLGTTTIALNDTITVDTSTDPVSFNLFNTVLQNVPSEQSKLIVSGSVTLTINSVNYTDVDGVFVSGSTSIGSINYSTGVCTLPQANAASSIDVSLSYYPMLPLVGFYEYSDSFSLAFDILHSYRVLPRAGVPQSFPRLSSYLGSNADVLSFSGSSSNLFSFAQANNYLFCTNGVSGNHSFAGITGVTRGSTTVLNVSAATASSFATNDVVFLCAFEGITELNGLTSVVSGTTSSTITLSLDSSSFTDYSSGGNIQLLSNSATGDGIKLFYETGYFNFSPPLDSSTSPSYLLGCDHMLFYNNRLMCFGTTEGRAESGGTYYPLRIRFSQVNNWLHFRTPFVGQTASSDGLTAWFEDVSTASGNAGFLDLSQGGRIVYAEVLRSYIICGLESGFTRLQPVTGRLLSVAPFVPFYYRSVLGSTAKTSAVHMDDFILSIGSKGIIGTTFNATKRLDTNIIDQFERVNYEGRSEFKTTSSRDTKREIVYINYVDDETNSQFPAKCFAYNYNNNTFAFLDQKFTTQGTITISTLPSWNDISSIRWDDLDGTWSQFLDDSFVRSTVGGTSQGVVLIRSEVESSAFSVLVESFTVDASNGTTTINSRNNSMLVGDYIRFSDLEFEEDNIVRVVDAGNDSFVVDRVCINATYSGTALGEFLPRVNIKTKAFNLWDQGQRIMLNSSAVLLDSDENLQLSLNVLSDQEDISSVNTNVSPVSKGSAFNPNQIRWIRSTYSNQEGDSVQLQITFNDEQMRRNITHDSRFKIHSIMLDLEQGGFLS